MDTTATAAVASLGTFLLTLSSQWLIARSPLHSRNAALEATNSELKNKVATLQNDNVASQAKILEQQKYIETHLSRDAILAKYEFDKTIGVYSRGGSHFCPHCLLNTPQVESPLALSHGEYTCAVCDKTYGTKLSSKPPVFVAPPKPSTLPDFRHVR